MRVRLYNGRTYRAQVLLPAIVKQVYAPTVVAAELQRHQLFGSVTDSPSGYVVQAQFRGQSGDYDLPDEVQDLVVIG
jgi:hypothetical protein